MSRLPGQNLKKSYFTFFELCPLQIWALETCNHGISKVIIARSFKHGQLVEDNDYLVKIKKNIYFFKLLPFVNLAFENFNKDTCIDLETFYS